MVHEDSVQRCRVSSPVLRSRLQRAADFASRMSRPRARARRCVRASTRCALATRRGTISTLWRSPSLGPSPPLRLWVPLVHFFLNSYISIFQPNFDMSTDITRGSFSSGRSRPCLASICDARERTQRGARAEWMKAWATTRLTQPAAVGGAHKRDASAPRAHGRARQPMLAFARRARRRSRGVELTASYFLTNSGSFMRTSGSSSLSGTLTSFCEPDGSRTGVRCFRSGAGAADAIPPPRTSGEGGVVALVDHSASQRFRNIRRFRCGVGFTPAGGDR